MQAFALAARFVLADIFLLSGLAKLPRRSEFTKAVRAYEVVSKSVADRIGRWLPPTELACGLLLFLGIGSPVAAAVVALLLLVFCVAVSANLVRGRRIECGCSGDVAPKRISWSLVSRNLGLAALALVCVVVGAPELSTVLGPWHAHATLGTGASAAIGVTVELTAALAFLVSNAARTRRAIVSYLDRLETV